MVKKLFLIIVTLFIFFSIENVHATCSDKALNNIAEKFSAAYTDEMILDPIDPNNYDVAPGEFSLYMDYVDPYAYYLVFTPYSDQITIKVTNNRDRQKEVIYSEKKETYIMGSYIHYDYENYTIKLYGNEKSACPNELLKTIKMEVPPFNEYSLYEFCEENKESYICTTMKDTSNISQQDYEKIVDNYEKENEFEKMNIPNKVLYLIKKYYLFVLIPLVLISIYYVIKIRKYKKKVEEQ